MARKAKTVSRNSASKKRGVQPELEETPVPDTGSLQDHVIERPDGFYWVSKDKHETYGPFATLAEAEADMLAGGVTEEAEAGESLQEAESELGISEWIDPDTGGPAEDNVPRIEDH
jgi:hypothetical protein